MRQFLAALLPAVILSSGCKIGSAPQAAISGALAHHGLMCTNRDRQALAEQYGCKVSLHAGHDIDDM